MVRSSPGPASGRRGRSGRRPDPTRWIARRERVKTRLIDKVPVLRSTRHHHEASAMHVPWAAVAPTHASIPEHGDHSVVSRGQEMARPASSSMRSDVHVVRCDWCPARLSRVAATRRPNVRSDAPSSSASQRGALPIAGSPVTARSVRPRLRRRRRPRAQRSASKEDGAHMRSSNAPHRMSGRIAPQWRAPR